MEKDWIEKINAKEGETFQNELNVINATFLKKENLLREQKQS